MSSTSRELDFADNFQSETQSGVVLVDFFATWCRPCQMQLPILNNVAEKMGDKVRILKVDTDKFGAIAQQFGVSSIPKLVILKNGKVVESFTGLQDESTLANALGKHVV